MTINNENISFTIYAIIWAYNCKNNWNFDLHIEDKAPADAKFAGLQGPKVVDEDYVLNQLKRSKREIKFVGVFQNTIYGGCFNKEQFPDYEIGDHICIFYEPILEEAKNEFELVCLVNEYVSHELRHAQQYTYLRSVGINPTDALEKEKDFQYGQGPLEKDAWAYQKGNIVPIEEAMACFL